MRRRYERRTREDRIRKRKNTANEIPPETKRAIIFIFLALASALSLLSVFGLAGDAGKIINEAFTALLGRTHILMPVLLLVLAAAIIVPERVSTSTQAKIGIAVFLVALNGTLHLIEKRTEPFSGVLGEGGGYLGIMTAYPMLKFLGFWAALIVLGAMTIAGIFLTFSLSVKHMLFALNLPRVSLKSLASFLARIFKKKNNSFQDSYGEEAIPRHADFSSRTLNSRPPAEAPILKENIITLDRPVSKPAAERPKRAPVVVPISFLNERKTKPSAGDIDATMERIRKTLENFGISVEMGDVAVGPSVSQYTLKPAEGVKLTRITALSDNLALALAAHPIRIEAPIPGKSLVGIEVPNQTIATVGLREILEAPQFKERKSSLVVALGKDVAGAPWLADLGKMPHLLVAGSTGSGKTVCLNAIITSLLYANGPETLQMIMIDPKRVELTPYKDIPHLKVPPITDVPKTINALKWAVSEMEDRFKAMEKVGHRDILSYNRAVEEKMPYIVIVVDELAELMVAAAAEIEPPIIRLAQMSRAVGIHLVLATQKPTVDIITGLIKSNITSRIAFAVASLTDSRTILDHSGAEKLLGRGDMLFLSAELSKPKRLQGAFVADDEINRVVNFWKSQGPAQYDMNIIEKSHGGSATFFDSDTDNDPLLEDAKAIVLSSRIASTSYLQRRLKLGYNRAARLLDILEKQNVVSAPDGNRRREVLLSGGETDIPPAPDETDIDFEAGEEQAPDEENPL